MQASMTPKRRLGDFEILRELGRGGMGIVYEARQTSLNRKVALKVLAGSLGLTTKAVVRFRREAEAAAKLHHTNIVPIYATGEADGTHYYAMELVEGPSLNLVVKGLRDRGTERRGDEGRGQRPPLGAGSQQRPDPRAVASPPVGGALADKPPVTPDAAPPVADEGARAESQPEPEPRAEPVPDVASPLVGGADAPRTGPDATTGVARADLQLSTEHRESPGTDTQSTVTSPLPGWVAETMIGEVTPARPTTPESTAGGGSTTLTTGGAYFDNVARMIADVADALDYAHNQGVIHRDMKPSNLLLSPDGRLSINDFGLARMLEQPGMTMTGEFVGSPLYMSPEQIAVGRAPLDHRTDIYSLGATLYELLTLEPPFPGQRRDQIIAQIIQKEPKPPRRHSKRVPLDLETICLKAMEKDPDRRYQTGGQMAEDLRRFVNRFAISAKRAGVVARTTKWVRRHPAVAALLAVVLVVGSAAGLFAYAAHRSNVRMIELQRDRAKEKAMLAAMNGRFKDAESAIQAAEMYGASAGWIRMLRGQVALHENRLGDAIIHLQQAVRLNPESMSANAMLALVKYDQGKWDEYVMMLDALDELTPVTAEDYMFYGWAHGGRGRRGLELLDKAVRMSPSSSIARVVRAQVRSKHAMDTADPADVVAALEDATTAKGMLTDSPVALQTHLYANVVAAHVYAARKQADARKEAFAEAERDVRALDDVVGLPSVHEARAYYADLIGDQAAVFDEWRKGCEGRHSNDQACGDYAFALYRRGETTEALAVLDQLAARGGGAEGELVRAYILVLMAQSDAVETARAAYAAAAKVHDSTIAVLWNRTVLRLLGDERTPQACNEIDAQFAQLPEWILQWYQNLVDYYCGRISADELLTRAGQSRGNQCEAHFFVGISALSEGDRARASKHFKAAVDTRVFFYFERESSRMLLHRLNQDPTWPPWIPLRDNAPGQTATSGDGKGG